MSNFLDSLNLDADEYRKLSAIGAQEPADLYAAAKASPEAFNKMLGENRAAEIMNDLKRRLSPEETERIETAQTKSYSLGVRLDTPPVQLKAPPYDIVKRNQLFDEMSRLKRGSQTEATQRRVAELQQELESLLSR